MKVKPDEPIHLGTTRILGHDEPWGDTGPAEATTSPEPARSGADRAGGEGLQPPKWPDPRVAECGTKDAPHWHVFGSPDHDSVQTYHTEAEARAALANDEPAATPTSPEPDTEPPNPYLDTAARDLNHIGGRLNPNPLPTAPAKCQRCGPYSPCDEHDVDFLAASKPDTDERERVVGLLADAMYEDGCLVPPQTRHADHVLAALRRSGLTLGSGADEGLRHAVESIRDLSEAATPGEWFPAWGSGGAPFGIRTKADIVPSSRSITKAVARRADAAFITAAVNIINAALADSTNREAGDG